jgi:hypothetical protein
VKQSLAAHPLLVPAQEAVIQFRAFCSRIFSSSFPRKREPTEFSRLPLGPRLRGDDEFVSRRASLTALQVGVHGATSPGQRSSGEVLPGRARPARAEEV